MKYRYDTHVHTSQVSSCAKNTGAELVDYYKINGYSGFIVTDHFVGSRNFLGKDEVSWQKKIESFSKGYLDAYKRGKETDFDVLFGLEYYYKGTEFIFLNLSIDQLVYGEEFLMSSDLCRVLEWVRKENGFVIHVHPFRVGRRLSTIRLIPDYTDAIEVFNGGNVFSWPDANEYAQYYAKTRNFMVTSGSDLHDTSSLISGGMEFDYRIKNTVEFINALKNKEGKLIINTLF